MVTLTVDGRFGALVALLERTDFEADLSRMEGGFTLFAPTDGNPGKRGPEAAPSPGDAADARAFLRAHVTSGIHTPWDLRNRRVLARPDGPPLPVVLEGRSLRIGKARVVGEPILVPGGVVFPVEGNVE